MTSPAHVLSVVKDGVMVITLNRAKAGNALAPETFQQIKAELSKAAADKAVKAVVVTGAGAFFSAGADVKAMAGAIMADPDAIADVLRNGSGSLTTQFIDFPKHIVAAVNGPVVGYPAGLLGLFDTVYVSSTASYSMPFLHLGIVPEACSSYTLPTTVGTALANDVLFNNRKLSADEMVAVGLAARKFDSDRFLESVVSLVTAGVKGAAPSSVLEAKKLIRGPLIKKLHDVNEAETAKVISQFGSGVPLKRFAAIAQSIGGKKKSKL